MTVGVKSVVDRSSCGEESFNDNDADRDIQDARQERNDD